MRYFVVSDVHGHYTELKNELEKNDFDKINDTLVVCGDLLDRGNENVKCIQYVNSLPSKVLIKGNHDYNLEKCLFLHRFDYADKHNGTVDTILEIARYVTGRNSLHADDDMIFVYANQYEELTKYMDSLVDYFEFTDKNGNEIVCCHGWLPENYKDEDCEDFEEYSWVNGMAYWKSGHRFKNKTVICGHWHCSFGNSKYHGKGSEFGEDAYFEPFRDLGIIAIDACTALTKKINVLVFEGK